jgi:hypothetical protein
MFCFFESRIPHISNIPSHIQQFKIFHNKLLPQAWIWFFFTHANTNKQHLLNSIQGSYQTKSTLY